MNRLLEVWKKMRSRLLESLVMGVFVMVVVLMGVEADAAESGVWVSTLEALDGPRCTAEGQVRAQWISLSGEGKGAPCCIEVDHLGSTHRQVCQPLESPPKADSAFEEGDFGVWTATERSLDPPSCTTPGKVCAEWITVENEIPYRPCCIDKENLGKFTSSPGDQCLKLVFGRPEV